MRARHPYRRWLAGLSFAGLTLTAVPSYAQVYGRVTQDDGQKYEGNVLYKPVSKEYVVTDKDGIAMNIAVRRVKLIQTRPPAELAETLKLVATKPDAAIPVLEKIMESYQMLEHDVTAATALADAYTRKADAPKVVSVCERLMDDHDLAALPMAFVRLYWDGLMATEQYGRLRKTLDAAVQKGNREAAALAQLKRGDMEKKQGNVKESLLDGYLRTAVLFQDVKGLQGEALYKACKAFEELGQHSQAEKMRKKLLDQFPNDPYAVRMKSGA